MPAAIELDHVFVFVAPEAPEFVRLKEAGLQESFRREHPGQGTANLCCCFDNAYLELLWLHDPDRARDPAVARMQLAERAAWKTSNASPFGIGLRTAPDEALPFETWDYAAPFLPSGMSIPVAVASDDVRQPLLFRSPGSTRPDRWTDGRGDTRQEPAGFLEIVGLQLDLPDGISPAPALLLLEDLGLLSLRTAGHHQMTLSVSGRDAQPQRLQLPDLTLCT